METTSREEDSSELEEIFRKMCLIRYFEFNVKRVFDAGLMPKIPIYLSVGQESIAASLSMVFPRAAIFGQHRGHDLYLAFGGDPVKLIDELLGLSTGCAGGMGGSASIHCPEIKMFGHDGLMGSQVPIAVGYALGTNTRTIAVMGDASAEEGYVLGALGYAATKKAPVLFVVADNGLSILTRTEVRRNWTMAKHAGFGMETLEISDDPFTITLTARHIRSHLPALLNIRTVRELWHAGTGRDNPPAEDNTFNHMRRKLQEFGLGESAKRIENHFQRYTAELWDKRLRAAGRIK